MKGAIVSDLPSPSPRKKRLSRREQKARKKQRLRHDGEVVVPTTVQPQLLPRDPSADTDHDDDESYEPTPIPTWEEIRQSHQQPSLLGKWFPNAVQLKSLSPPSSNNSTNCNKASLVLFYQYVNPPWSESKVDVLMAYLTKLAQRHVLGGRIRVAPEGMNATVSSIDSPHGTAARTLRRLASDLKHFDMAFKHTDFKFVDQLSGDRHFAQLKLFPVQELVYYGIRQEQAPLEQGGTHLTPHEFHQKLQEPGVVVVDVRNHYEAVLGRFDGQNNGGGAAYVDPKMRKSTDFPQWLDDGHTQETLNDKTVLLYCTGGVRCERASAYLNQKMGDNLRGVYQLKGGIEAYLQEFHDGGYWRGKNFVFDKREAVSAQNTDGDGGVVRRRQGTEKNAVETHCCVCDEPWDRYVGKKKCSTCGVPVLVCESCLSASSKDKTVAAKRCPLCVEQNVTVRVEEVEYTDNGVSGRIQNHIDDRKAAPSVLKWGGGHAASKKNRRRQPCRYGLDCTRPNCVFVHPEKKGVDGPME